MSTGFLKELGLPAPDRNLEVGSASHAVQTANVMIGIREGVPRGQARPGGRRRRRELDDGRDARRGEAVDSGGALEAGLRSFDRTMPEEINRIVTDRLADLLLTPSPDADDNLRAEGVPTEDRIHLVGNIMIDTLMRQLPLATLDRLRGRVDVTTGAYAVLTLHRPSNVDDPEALRADPRSLARDCARSCRSCFRCIRARASGCGRSASTHARTA